MTVERDLAVPNTSAEAPQEVLARCRQAAALAGKAQRVEALRLVEMLGDPHPFVRWEVCQALAVTVGLYAERPRLGTSVAVRSSRVIRFSELLEAVTEKLHSPEPYVRAAAAEALGLWRQTQVIGVLTKALKDEDPSVRSSAAMALGHIGDHDALKPLLAALEDPSIWVRRAAAEALGQIGDARAVGPLCAALGREPALVRGAVAAALGHLATCSARRALIACLKDDSVEVRWQAVRGLERIGDLKALAALEAFVQDETPILGEPFGAWAKRAALAIKRREVGFWNALRKGLHVASRRLRAGRQRQHPDRGSVEEHETLLTEEAE